MTRRTATFTVSLPPEMLAKAEEIYSEEHRTRSELIREALRQYARRRMRDSEVSDAEHEF